MLAAYDQVLKCSHLFNLLDARGAISVTERVGVIKRVRDLAVGTAKIWADRSRRLMNSILAGDRHRRNSALDDSGRADAASEAGSISARRREWMRRRGGWWCELRGVPERTPDQEQIVKGPPIAAGEKAARGFREEAGRRSVGHAQGRRLLRAAQEDPGPRGASTLLAESLPAAILGIQWPKTMYWTGGKTGPRFIRPIRWIVALLGDEVIPFEIAGVKSGNVTRGHRMLGSSIDSVTIANYESELRKNFVILSAHERRHKIETEASALGAKLDADLLETLTFITEYPTAIQRRLRSGLSGTARRSADHRDAASSEIFLGGSRARHGSRRTSSP